MRLRLEWLSVIGCQDFSESGFHMQGDENDVICYSALAEGADICFLSLHRRCLSILRPHLIAKHPNASTSAASDRAGLSSTPRIT